MLCVLVCVCVCVCVATVCETGEDQAAWCILSTVLEKLT